MNKQSSYQPVIIKNDVDRVWTVVKTKSRCEKKISELCSKRDIPFYLPLQRSIKYYKNKRVEFMIPVFSGYIFVHLNCDAKKIVEEFRHTAQLLTPDKVMEQQLIAELNDIEMIAAATAAGKLIIRPEIVIGQSALIKSGSLAGLSGIVSRRNNKTRVSVNVEMIGFSVSIDVDVRELEIDY